MLTLLAFLVAIGLLVAVHEYGHYRVAVACGVKVLRFSVGFGKPLWSWRSPRSGTEYVLGALPLGGYVRMLDEREAAVPAAERHLAFNTQSLRVRTAIVAAGPAANLLLAVLLYALVAWMGVPQPQPVLSTPAPASLAERAGVRGGEWVVALAREGDAPQPIESFGDLRWQLTRAALAQQDLKLWLASGPGEPGREVRLELSQVDVRHADATLMRQIGIEARGRRRCWASSRPKAPPLPLACSPATGCCVSMACRCATPRNCASSSGCRPPTASRAPSAGTSSAPAACWSSK